MDLKNDVFQCDVVAVDAAVLIVVYIFAGFYCDITLGIVIDVSVVIHPHFLFIFCGSFSRPITNHNVLLPAVSMMQNGI